jgi:hypothetical protein
MKITIKHDGKTYRARQPFAGADHVVAYGVCCGRITGRNPREDHDTVTSDAFCVCGKAVGTIRVKVSTIFGIEEDRAVLNGRARVY